MAANLNLMLEMPEFSGEREKLALAHRRNGYHGSRLLHLNATHEGGGVVAMNTPLMPSLNRAGIISDWKQITTSLPDIPQDFFEFTKGMHNMLQGAHGSVNANTGSVVVFENVSRGIASAINFDNYDVIIVDDPQPVAVEKHARKILGAKRSRQTWIWRCHIDLTAPNDEAQEFLLQQLEGYDAAIFTMDSYVPEELRGIMPIAIIPPGINPYGSINTRMPREQAFRLLHEAGINVDEKRPLITQVSRFDPWKDPIGVIEVYKTAKKEVKGLQLLLNGQPAPDDPEGERIYTQVIAEARDDPDIHVCLNTKNGEEAGLLGAASQTAADIVIQKSLREGYGLTVSEALWKGKLVIANNVGGIPLQIRNRVNGILVDPERPDDMATEIAYYLKNPDEARKMEENAAIGVRTVSDVVHDYITHITPLLKKERKEALF